METIEIVGPDLATLRPLHGVVSTPTFPVYPDLAERLAHVTAYPDDVAAHLLAVCSGYAYGEASTVATILARLGLDENHCLMIRENVEPMFICSTAYVIQSKCGRIAILCYRGTEPVNLINWLTDADTSPTGASFFPTSSRRCDIHSGFYRNVRATRHEIVRALERALNGESVLPEHGKRKKPPHRLQTLYVTGHSLGGAMAATMGVMLAVERDYAPLATKMKGIYTYGQPMIGSRALADECCSYCADGAQFLRDRLVRYVYRGDPVPALPPLISGDFAHFGREILLEVEAGRFRASEQRVPTPQMIAGEAVQFLPAAVTPATQFRDLSFRYAPLDHGPQNYIAALTPPSVRTTEFGDDALTPVRRPPTRLAFAVSLARQLIANAQARVMRRMEPLLTGAQDQVRRLSERGDEGSVATRLRSEADASVAAEGTGGVELAG